MIWTDEHLNKITKVVKDFFEELIWQEKYENKLPKLTKEQKALVEETLLQYLEKEIPIRFSWVREHGLRKLVYKIKE